MTRPPAWFRALLRILPRPFRDAHAADIVEVACRYASERQGIARGGIWLRAAADVVAVAVATRFGSEGGVAGGARSRRPAAGIGTLGQDVRYGLRSLGRDRGFTAFAILIVGLGVGASVTVFSVVRALLLRPLPFEDPTRLVWISNGEWGRGQQLSSISVQVGWVVDMRADASQLEDVAGYHLFDGDGDHTLGGVGEPERVTRLRVTENLFSVLGVEPVIGRLFTREEAWDDGPPAVLLTHGFWRRRFAGSPDVVGRSVRIDGSATTVVGVLPAAFDFTSIFAPGRRIDYVAPYPLSEESNGSGNTLGLIARLAPGATVASAQDEVEAIAEGVYEGRRRNALVPIVQPLRGHVSRSFRTAVLVLVGAVALVMLIVCANLSNLMLARGATRERELAIRSAIGAHRHRLVRQLLTESTLLSGAGALLGVALAHAGTRYVASRQLPIPLLGETKVDTSALVVAAFAAFAVGILFGILPALRGSAVSLQAALRDDGRGSPGVRKSRLRNALVASEVALACLLLVVSALMTRSLVAVLEVDLGYEAEGAVAIRVDPAQRFTRQAEDERRAFYGAIIDRARAVPGVSAAGLTDMLPMGFNRRWSVRATDGDAESSVSPFVRVVTDGYLAAMRSTLVAGRDFEPEDERGEPVALINEALGEALWPEASPDAVLGRSIRTGGSPAAFRVVGIVEGTRQRSAEQEPGLELFLPLRQVRDASAVHLVLRGDGDPSRLLAEVREEIRAVAPSLPLDVVVALRDVVDSSIAPRRFLVWLLGAFAAFALLLASLGIYGVISYSVAQRRHEIGIHLALGASTAGLRSRVVAETVALAAMGLLIGLVASVAAGRVLGSLLFEVRALDPPTYAAVALLLLAVAAVAGYLPARRVSSVSPVESLGAPSGR